MVQIQNGQITLSQERQKPPSQKELIETKLKILFPEEPKTFAEKLKYFRIKNSLLQEDLAKKLGLNVATICRYERNRTHPAPEIIHKLSKTLKTNLSS
ncbi:MAG: helix-turn-helix transcriptional regulator [Elusimicrobiota bacterium]